MVLNLGNRGKLKTLGFIATALIALLTSCGSQKDDVVEITPEFIEAVHQFDELYPFSEGMAAVKKDNKFGYINTKGELIIPCQYSYAGPFKEDLACVVEDENDKKISFIDTKGEIFKTSYPLNIGITYNGYVNPEKLSFQNGICEITYFKKNQFEAETICINKQLKEVDKSNKKNFTPKENEYKIYSELSKSNNIYGDTILLYGLKDKKGNTIIPANYYKLKLCDNGVVLASLFIENANSYIHRSQHKPYGLQIDGYIDLNRKSTFTDTDMETLRRFKSAQTTAWQRVKREEEEVEREQQREDDIKSWLQGNWYARNGYGEVSVNISGDYITVWMNGEQTYNGTYEIEGSELVYNRHNGIRLTLDFDYDSRTVGNSSLRFERSNNRGSYSSSNTNSSYSSHNSSISFNSPHDVLRYITEHRFKNYYKNILIRITYDGLYVNGTCYSGAPRVTNFDSSSAVVKVSSPQFGGSDITFSVYPEKGYLKEWGGDTFYIVR